MTRRITEELNAIDQLGAATFRGAAGISRARHVLFGNRRRDQREIQDRLFAQRRDRPRQADGTCRSGAAPGSAPAAAEALVEATENHGAAASQIARAPSGGVLAD